MIAIHYTLNMVDHQTIGSETWQLALIYKQAHYKVEKWTASISRVFFRGVIPMFTIPTTIWLLFQFIVYGNKSSHRIYPAA